ncbi:hypothetical protein ASG31_17690 [Chryseobacterium sp. Leaf404]|uniref:hypothetical protein n=1 Tax=unclassified Chryseobacterium TaxID=2593645 RepID=UPI00070212E3|nr:MULTISPECIES: hypothetical protein [unclassified Chryseobacterium]KQT20262.1 hypothetical protein ASG31_17690 [Chryseobacterium sp. Leaf404]
MNTLIKTENGENIGLNIVDGESIEINFSKKKIILTEDDLKQLTSSIREHENNFDSVVFRWLQVKITNYSKKEMEKLSDERLFALARYNDKNPPHYKIFTMNLRSELFKHHGLPKANYKLTFKQKAFLYAHGLSRN